MLYSTSTSSLASSIAQKSDLSDISERLKVAGEKLATGQLLHNELVASKSIDGLNLLDNSLNLNDVYKQSNSILSARMNSVQSNLDVIRKTANEVSLSVLNELSDLTGSSKAANEAMGALETVVNSLNATHIGLSIFSGVALDRPAVADAATIVADIKGLLESAADVATALTDVELYFQDPLGGFQSTIYLGTNGASQDWEIAHGRTIEMELQADHDAIKETIQNLATMAAATSSTVLAKNDQNFILRSASERNLNTNNSLIELQGFIGYKQELLAHYMDKNDAETFALTELRSDTVSVDLFQQAAIFEELQSSLEASYQIVSRLAGLRLSNFL